MYESLSTTNQLVINEPFYHLDVAIVTQSYSQIKQNCGYEHLIELDPIDITENDFKLIFYKNNNFAIETNIRAVPSILQKITFSNQSQEGKPFCLIDAILQYIETDLGITKNMISSCSLITLNREINSLLTLCDLSVSNVSCSLNWSDIINTLKCEFGSQISVTPPLILIISVVFLSPTTEVHPIVVKFHFKTSITLN